MGRGTARRFRVVEGLLKPPPSSLLKNPSVPALKKRRATSPFAKRRTGRRL